MSASIDEPRRFYDEVAIALLKGSNDRPPLPHELVCLICRLARYRVPTETLQSKEPIKVRASSARRVTSLWLETRPFSQSDISNTAVVTIKTRSRHQGWVSLPDHGSWSWFALAILAPKESTQIGDVDQIRRGEDGGELMWCTFANPVDSRGWVDGTSTIDIDHDIWKHLRPGDSIGLFACAQFGGWSCEGEYATVTIERFYEPPT